MLPVPWQWQWPIYDFISNVRSSEITKCGKIWREAKTMSVIIPKLNNICHFSYHLTVFKSSCIVMFVYLHLLINFYRTAVWSSFIRIRLLLANFQLDCTYSRMTSICDDNNESTNKYDMQPRKARSHEQKSKRHRQASTPTATRCRAREVVDMSFYTLSLISNIW